MAFVILNSFSIRQRTFASYCQHLNVRETLKRRRRVYCRIGKIGIYIVCYTASRWEIFQRTRMIILLNAVYNTFIRSKYDNVKRKNVLFVYGNGQLELLDAPEVYGYTCTIH